ncbi:hypothetical protein BBO99_00006990 [Phytophthora kernoviae]|uniref:Bidirectional sugar transporter SWEET n=2 Tax=Phytophthora kernoviae TaxID=325452 RepID=A0A3R7IHC8_9STRA|nr:hypothetical protein G195_007876 [Phytophthora kernoviae 00238/432]KAG2520759.1 hypothetical protein JM16_006599 [Phytophthora kernoviae]KAG2521801.1 hypothetical protein JM18_006427 [Phytophthora kernoviae]RLN14013.1 hypothetical protein BBI17_006982 [Phytophthora kernoviae]RLN77142.1 hypothetical protein BBO99_00006990 [Phytophthora kernoviae]
MSSHSTAVLVFRILAGMATTTMVSSPSLLMYRIHKQKNVGVASIIPIAALLGNSHMWMMYGYLTDNWFPVFSCFLYGNFCAIAFLSVYSYYTTDKRYVIRVLSVVLSVLALATVYVVIGRLGYTGQTRKQLSTVVGFISDVASICLYGAPMEKLFQVFKHKSAVFINVHMVIAGLANNTIWLIYGSLISNWFIISINILFVSLNTFTLFLYRAYDPKTHPLQDGWDTHPENDDKVSVTIEMVPQMESMVSKKSLTSLPSPEYSSLASPVLHEPWN